MGFVNGWVSSMASQRALSPLAVYGRYAMGYQNVYVASCAMGADYAQTVAAFKEAEAYEGTSLLLCYSP